MHPDLLKLLALQAKDVALLEAHRQLGEVVAEVDALDRQVAEAACVVEQAQQQVAADQRRRLESEAKLENYRKLDERGRQRLELVRGAKEIQAVMTELDLARSVLAKEEAEWLRLAEAIAAGEAAVKEGEQRQEELRRDQEPVRAEIALRRKRCEAERVLALSARDGAAGEVDRVLRSRYERLRSVRPTVVVALDGAACGACFTTVPLNRRTQIRAGTLIDACESCGVILYASDAVE